VPTRSTVEAWDTTHLSNAAQHWRRARAKWAESFDYLHRNSYTAGGVDFSGEGAQALQNSTHERSRVVASMGIDLDQAADIAERGAQDIGGMKQSVAQAISAAENEGYTVSEDFSVHYLSPSFSEQLARRPQILEHQSVIAARVADLVERDKEVSGQLGSIQLTDYRTSPPPPVPPPNPADRINDYYRGIAEQTKELPCPVPPEPPPPSNWEKVTTPGPGKTGTDLADAWATYVGSLGAVGMGMPGPAGWLALLAVKPSYDDLMSAYGLP
jgi:hypothetical protein